MKVRAAELKKFIAWAEKYALPTDRGAKAVCILSVVSHLKYKKSKATAYMQEACKLREHWHYQRGWGDRPARILIKRKKIHNFVLTAQVTCRDGITRTARLHVPGDLTPSLLEEALPRMKEQWQKQIDLRTGISPDSPSFGLLSPTDETSEETFSVHG